MRLTCAGVANAAPAFLMEISMRNLILVLALCSTLFGCSQSEPTASGRLAQAAEYLWSQQAEDGGWHSEVHGILRGGEAWTPFVMNALMQVPESVFPAPEEGIERGLQFIREHVNRNGVLGLSNPAVMEYPNYATAYALKVFAEIGAQEDSSLVRRMSDYLEGQQFTEQRGITSDHVAYGSWGFGETNLPDGQIGHVDLSHTRRVLQGLQAAGLADSATFQHARIYLRFIQKNPEDQRSQPPGNVLSDSSIYDGGFYSSPTAEGMNKGCAAQSEEGEPLYFRSYATTTADGLLGLLASGLETDNPAVQDAADWLRAHPQWEAPEGIPEDDAGQWHRVMFFYHIAVRSEAYAAIGEAGAWQEQVQAVLAPHQHEDGHFSNPDGAPNKEDDPLLATAMMVETLVRVINQ